jgi:hypothetical protein
MRTRRLIYQLRKLRTRVSNRKSRHVQNSSATEAPSPDFCACRPSRRRRPHPQRLRNSSNAGVRQPPHATGTHAGSEPERFGF